MAAFPSDSDKEAQEQSLEDMRNAFRNYQLDPQDEYFDLGDATLQRYLRARQWDFPKAQEMLNATLKFRQDFFNDGYLTSKGYMNSMVTENATGKIYVRQHAADGSAIMIMRPRFENTYCHDGNVKHIVYSLERACASMKNKGNPTDKITLLIDYEGYSLFNAPPYKTSRATLDILQNHYPERLSRAYCIRPPWIFNAFWTMISPFIDPITKDKVKMISAKKGNDVAEHLFRESGGAIGKDILEEEFGGTLKAPFDSSTYLFGEPNIGADAEGGKEINEKAKSMFGKFFS